jgi:hypothetical protein
MPVFFWEQDFRNNEQYKTFTSKQKNYQFFLDVLHIQPPDHIIDGTPLLPLLLELA